MRPCGIERTLGRVIRGFACCNEMYEARPIVEGLPDATVKTQVLGGNAAALFLEMMGDGTLSEGMTARMHRSLGGGLPGHYDIGKAPAPLWPPR